MNDVLYTPDEVAEVLRVHPATVRRWIATGSLSAIKLPGGNWRIPDAELTRLRQGIEVAAAHAG